jgi:PST family polysaccharide transporter
MQSKIQHNSREKKNLIKNIFSLGTLQTVDYLVPILLIPYLLRVIGIENYGVLAFSAAIVTYFALLTDYGFNLSATRLVSLNRDNKEKLNEIFSAVLSLKILLFVIGLILITIVIFSIEKVGEHIEIVYLTFAMVLGTALFPLWLFQGLEKMGYITLINSSSKVFFALLIFVFVQDAEDFWLVPLLTSAGFIFGGVLGLWTASKIFAVTFKFCSITTLKYYLIEGKHAFVATAGSSLYRNSNIVILGLLTTPTLVGFYAIAEKVIQIIQRFQGVFGDALYPFFSKKIKDNNGYFFVLDKSYRFYIFAAYIMVVILLMVLAPLIVTILTGNNEPQAVFLIQIMSVVILIGGMNYYYGILGLMTMDYKKSFSSFILVAGVFSLLSCTLLTYFFKDVGAALALILSELLLLSLILNKIHKIKKLSV